MTWSLLARKNLMTVLVVAGCLLSIALAWLATLLVPANDATLDAMGIAMPVEREYVMHREDLHQVEQGRSYYAQLCMACHGARGNGQGEWAYRVIPRPANLLSARTQQRSDEQLFHIISEGLTATAMQSWKKHLTPQQRWQVIAYVRHLGISQAQEMVSE